MKEQLFIPDNLSYATEIGKWIWALEDVRQNLLKNVESLTQEQLDEKINHHHSIGTLLYHIAYVEAGWLYGEVLEKEFDEEIKTVLPYEGWTNGKLTSVTSESIEQHLHRLQIVRDKLLYHFQQMDVQDFKRPRQLPEYDVTPEWVLYHLVEHEAHHRGQVFAMLPKTN